MGGVGGIGFTPFVTPRAGDSPVVSSPTAAGGAASTGSTAATGPGGQSFGDMVVDGIERLEQTQDRADQLSVQAATGDAASMHSYMMAATEASVTTQVTVAARNKALEAFTEIMRLPIG
ncbi:flagellar hook-basal body complex protein FliE [Nocardioidaceae bacterium]|nr:flagellar hook-basal body complex protein FliE [Nocardioidaceae bacterium]